MLDITKLDPSQVQATFTDMKIANIIPVNEPHNGTEVVVVFVNGNVTVCNKDGTNGSENVLFKEKSGLCFKYPVPKLQLFRDAIEEFIIQTNIKNWTDPRPVDRYSIITTSGICSVSELLQFISDVEKEIHK